MKVSVLLTYTIILVVQLFLSCNGEEPALKIEDKYPTGKCENPAQEGDIVTWMAAGNLEDGGKAFDIAEYETKIGNNEAPAGVDQGLRGLCVKDERTLVIPPELAYGTEGLDKRVPANATVIYDIEVLNITRGTEERNGLLMNKMFDFKDTNVVENCGMKVQGDDKIKWAYIGTLTNGVGFDSGDFSATIDHGHVIKGVNEAMKGLCVGGKRRMIMHHSYAYGPSGTGGIPRYANLIFQVHLKSLDRPGVGSQDIEMAILSAHVTKESPVKIIDASATGVCEQKVKVGDRITWNGTGYLLTGKIFDDYSVTITIGDGRTIPALENALLGLCEGDHRSVTIHPDAAFGEAGVKNMVPMHATVIYDISVEKINPKVEL